MWSKWFFRCLFIRFLYSIARFKGFAFLYLMVLLKIRVWHLNELHWHLSSLVFIYPWIGLSTGTFVHMCGCFLASSLLLHLNLSHDLVLKHNSLIVFWLFSYMLFFSFLYVLPLIFFFYMFYLWYCWQCSFFQLLYAAKFITNLKQYLIFQELLTRHKSTVAEFLSKNYDWVSSFSL